MIIQRNILDKLLKQSESHAVSILIGARQVGKSTLFSQLQEKFKIPCRYINLENPLHLKVFSEGYTSFIHEVPEDIVLIDEFHYCLNITSIFKAVYDLHPDKKIYASGSSSLEIHKHLKESLAGRQIHNDVYPLSFAEWLLQFDVHLPEKGEYISLETKNALDMRLDDFLAYGTMPGLIHQKSDLNKREYLQGIYQTYIAKDIKTFLKDESVLSFNKMIEYLVINNTQQLNVNTLSNIAGVSVRQVNRQLEVMGGTYTLGLLRPFCSNKTKEIVKTPKTYFYDQGIANIITGDFRAKDKRGDCGAILEQFVYWEIIKSLDVRFSLKYWRTVDRKEVDFVIEKDKECIPVEVKRSWNIDKIPKGIKAFLKYYPQTKAAVVLTDCQDRRVRYDEADTMIYFMPWYNAAYVKDLLLT